ncbi:SDR family NAD(P)-dependent oxidoreductase [Nocardia harenae]|uniref:SDR family NAD(P)-dependent oxidoreductase n=1 Tax=Nocardia harenae TaxID=358707 RepID=UPI000829E2AF|nr:3-oxoacyl-ACP reductase family protein [Nocardia harenae]
MIDLTGRTALVTGSGTGIGRGIALKLAEVGATVIVNGLYEAPCKETVELLAAEGHESTVLLGDVSDEATVDRLFEQIGERFGGLDILVNNAGIQRVSWFDTMTEQDWSDVLRVNLTAPFLMSRAFARQMRERRYGRIVNICSEGALVGSVGNTNYVAAKAGLMGLTMNVAQEMAIWARKDSGDYTCNAVHPGFNRSEMAAKHSDAELERVLKLVPLGRVANSREDVGSVVAFLASPQAAFVTGVKFSAGGGFGMCIAS